jgi:hypothetical protein
MGLRLQVAPQVLKRDERVSFMYYLNEQNLLDMFYLTQNGSLSFHWANWRESCLYQQKLLETEFEQRRRFKDLTSNIEKLKNNTIWLRSPLKTVRTTLYDLPRS